MKLSVRNQKGDMVPFSSFTTLEEQEGLDQVTRYNMYTAAAITAIPAQGYSTRQAIEGMEELTRNVLGTNFGYSWTSEAYQETQSS